MTAYEYLITAPGLVIPQESGYLILSALSRKFPFLHGKSTVQVAPVRGTRTTNHKLRLDNHSILHIRGISPEQATELSGSWVTLLGAMVALGSCRSRELKPSPYLASRLVVLDGVFDEVEFKASLETLVPSGTLVTVGRSRSLPVKGMHQKGYSVHLDGLSDEVSLELQNRGIGKYTSMGCGVLYPGRERAAG